MVWPYLPSCIWKSISAGDAADCGRQAGQACLETYDAFEDVLMIALAPLYRRGGWFPLHAFAALSPQGRAAEAYLVCLACTEAPDGQERWSMQLLADKLIALGVVETVSRETVHTTLKK